MAVNVGGNGSAGMVQELSGYSGCGGSRQATYRLARAGETVFDL